MSTIGQRARPVASMFGLQRAGVVYALIIIVVAFEVLTAGSGIRFASGPNFRNILDQTAFDGILVVAMTVLLITGNFDLSIGATAGLSGAVALVIANEHGAALGVLAAMAAGLAVGTINGILVVKAGINSFIVTLGTLTAVSSVLLLVTNGQNILAENAAFQSVGTGSWRLPPAVVGAVGLLLVLFVIVRTTVMRRRHPGHPDHPGGNSAPLITPTGVAGLACGVLLVAVAFGMPGLTTLTRPTWFMVAFMAGAAFVLRFTVVGRRVYASGGNPEAARLSGINVVAYKIAGFLLTGLAAGFVGILYVGKFGAVSPTALTNEMLPVLAAAILGGTSLFGGAGSVLKSIIGALILGSLGNGFALLNLSPNYQGLIQGLVIIAAAMVYTVGARRVGRGRGRTPRRDDTEPQQAGSHEERQRAVSEVSG